MAQHGIESQMHTLPLLQRAPLSAADRSVAAELPSHYAALGDDSHALRYATRGGHREVAQLLLNKDASINKLAHVSIGGTPLH